MRYAALVLMSILCAGCLGSVANGVAGMDAAEIKEVAKIKDAAVSCVRGVYAGGVVVGVFINVDKGIPSGMTVDETCKVTFNTTIKEAK